MGKSTRGVEAKSAEDLDERQIAAWMIQVAAVPGVGGKKGQVRERMSIALVLDAGLTTALTKGATHRG
ncbi:MAG TPA: hypothetical protein VL424_19240, partial [Pararobbsia sp.]|nr:hypothetical protein [Pararobbsia sp.]